MWNFTLAICTTVMLLIVTTVVTAENRILISAIEDGDINIVKSELSKPDVLKSIQPPNCDALFDALVIYPDNDIAQLLIDNGASVNTTCEESPLVLIALIEENIEALRLLIKNGASIDILHGENQKSLLHFAASSSSLDILQLLLENGLNIEAKDKSGVTSLFDAIHAGKYDNAMSLIEHGARIDTRDVKTGKSLLHLAAANYGSDLLKLLIDRGVPVNTQDKNGNTPLVEAIRDENVENTKFLIEHGASIDARDNKSGKTLLHLAAMSYDSDLLELLITKGVSVNTQDNDGNTPLVDAVRAGKFENTKILIEHNAQVDVLDRQTGKTLLHLAAANYGSDLLKLLIEKGVSVNVLDNNGNTPLHIAASESLKSLKLLIETGADTGIENKAGLRPVDISLVSKKYESVTELFKAGTGKNLHPPSFPGHAEALGKMLCDAVVYEYADLELRTSTALALGAKINYPCDTTKGDTPLKLVIDHRYRKKNRDRQLIVFNTLLDYKPDLEFFGQYDLNTAEEPLSDNQISYSSSTPLLVAVAKGKPGMTTRLLELGARIDATNALGQTVLHIALKNKQMMFLTKDFVTKSVSQGINIDSKDNQGETALHITAGLGSHATLDGDFNPVTVVETLLELGANPNLRNRRKQSPVHIAAGNWQHGKEISELLINYDVNINATDDKFQTPLYIAEKERHSEIVALLVENGATLSNNRLLRDFFVAAVDSPRLSSALMMLLFYITIFLFTFRLIARSIRNRKANRLRKQRLRDKPRLLKELKSGGRIMMSSYQNYIALFFCLIPGAIGTQLAVIFLGKTAGWLVFFTAFGLLLVLFPKIKRKINLKTEMTKREEAPDAAEVLNKDDGTPVLYLRSFERDNQRNENGLVEAFAPVNLPHEVELAELCWEYGPVVAVGRPNEQLPPLGAARMYFNDDIWQDEVLGLMNQSCLIILVLDLSEGVWWEVNQVFGNKHWRKTVFLMPVGADYELRKKITDRFSATVKMYPHIQIPEHLVSVEALYFDSNDTGIVVAPKFSFTASSSVIALVHSLKAIGRK